ncbi:hypothetical protein L3Q82_019196 [Scortum barcoo]|uniref:Uncharacterized protein n=1 Tax=Scortum barcoo TaxID=214431 RepID=A0ACB8VHH5_9TELE|nr:hypothetical protein L3Q82_019196 [Scortum barcoo]
MKWGPGAFLLRAVRFGLDLFPVHVGLQQGCPLSPVLLIIFMDRISRRSQGPEGVQGGVPSPGGWRGPRKEFKYLGVLFTSEGKMEREIDRWIGAVSAVMRSYVLDRHVVKKELSQKGKALDFTRVNLRSHPHLWS